MPYIIHLVIVNDLIFVLFIMDDLGVPLMLGNLHTYNETSILGSLIIEYGFIWKWSIYIQSWHLPGVLGYHRMIMGNGMINGKKT